MDPWHRPQSRGRRHRRIKRYGDRLPRDAVCRNLDLAVIGPGVRPGDLDTGPLVALGRPVDTLFIDPARDSYLYPVIAREGIPVWSRRTDRAPHRP